MHTDREGAPASIRVLSVCPPVKFLGEMFGEMNGGQRAEGRAVVRQTKARLAYQQPGLVGEVGRNEV